tara:strand:+ start:734 stop:1003 length:270 start_codon:yes stop_codon:yes gene_type:complete
MKNIKINKYMKNKKTLALIGIGAFLVVNDLHNHSHFNKIEKKLDHITRHTVTHAWERTIEIQKGTIDSLLITQMDLGAKLDSCELVNTK